MTKQFYVYILAKERNGTFYTGFSSDLAVRVAKHKNETYDGYTKKYNVKKLVYYEIYGDAETAIKREKLIKKWSRQIKMQAIEKQNPEWNDLYDSLF